MSLSCRTVKFRVPIPLKLLTSVVLSPFQHPCLTPGQKRYLFTAAKAHSKDHVRKLICQHYLNVLHRSTSTGVSSPATSDTDNLHPTAEEKSRGSGRDAGGGKAKGKAESRKRLILPKINSHRKR
uniref:Uncharacterized protein n=1 Tax=Astyanax mexicanus TaxID=7994 RepID=A0A3B1KJE8_ASTMX